MWKCQLSPATFPEGNTAPLPQQCVSAARSTLPRSTTRFLFCISGVGKQKHLRRIVTCIFLLVKWRQWFSVSSAQSRRTAQSITGLCPRDKRPRGRAKAGVSLIVDYLHLEIQHLGGWGRRSLVQGQPGLFSETLSQKSIKHRLQ